MTNADKYFRNATDEELAKVLMKKYCPAYFGADIQCDTKSQGCYVCWIDFLRQEVQE